MLMLMLMLVLIMVLIPVPVPVLAMAMVIITPAKMNQYLTLRLSPDFACSARRLPEECYTTMLSLLFRVFFCGKRCHLTGKCLINCPCITLLYED